MHGNEKQRTGPAEQSRVELLLTVWQSAWIKCAGNGSFLYELRFFSALYLHGA